VVECTLINSYLPSLYLLIEDVKEGNFSRARWEQSVTAADVGYESKPLVTDQAVQGV
jgi:hypothetical protein